MGELHKMLQLMGIRCHCLIIITERNVFVIKFDTFCQTYRVYITICVYYRKRPTSVIRQVKKGCSISYLNIFHHISVVWFTFLTMPVRFKTSSVMTKLMINLTGRRSRYWLEPTLVYIVWLYFLCTRKYELKW